MPELPEVENVRRGLIEGLPKNPVIEEAKCLSKTLRVPLDKKMPLWMRGQIFKGVDRRAKYLLFRLDNGIILSHLGMTGVWRFETTYQPKKHDHFWLRFVDGRYLIYNDVRRFGVLEIVKNLTTNRWLKKLGPEPLDEMAFTAEYLLSLARTRSAPIKNIIMDQRVVAGIGNIYACEALFMAKIKPGHIARRLKIADCERLVSSIRLVLKKSIELGGSTISDYRQTNGQSGKFQDEFFVYGRRGQKCRDCRGEVAVKLFAGRSTFWCSRCQK